MNPRDMKTVLMLDRSARFLDLANECTEFTIREGARQKKLQVAKNIWTCCLEGVFEIHRILSDVYPDENMQLRFAVATGCIGKMMETEWNGKFIKREEMVKMFKKITMPSPDNTDVSATGGLTMAIEALAVETPEQKYFNYDAKYSTETRTSQNSEVVRFGKELIEGQTFSPIQNSGNLIVFTRLKTEEEMVKLQQEVAALVISRNKIAHSPSNKTFCPITSLRLFIVNFYPTGEKCTVKTRPLEEHPDLPLLKIWVISRRAIDLATAVHSLLVAAFDLGSTTVTKIPMKEDNRGSSNYDVELFHSASVQKHLREAKLIDTESKNANNDEGVTYDSMSLAWTTAPKKKWSLFPHYGQAVPCTTAQAYSRPSACLTQFVRDGRCVMLDLEHTSDLGMNILNKLVSHLLVANRGRIFIQEIDFIQKKDKVVGTLVPATRLRAPKEQLNLHQLVHTYKQMQLKIIAKNRMDNEMTEEEKGKWDALPHSDIDKRFELISRNIPMFAKDTFIFNKVVQKQLEPLITTITKLTLTDKDVEDLINAIVHLLQVRTSGELIVPADADIGECSVSDLGDPSEQMRVALVELAKHMMKYVTYSDKHDKVYKTFMSTMSVEQLLEVDANDRDAADKNLTTFPFFGRSETDDITDDESGKKNGPKKIKDGFEAFLEQRKIETREFMKRKFEEQDRHVKRRTEEKPVIIPKEVKIDIFAIMCEKIEKKEKRIRREFVGREMHGAKAPLYPQLAEKTDRSASPVPPERAERVRNADRGGSGTPPPTRRPYN